MPLLGELDRERKCLRLPRLGEHWAAGVAREARRCAESIARPGGVRLAQGSRPTYRYRRHLVARPGRPTIPERRSAPSKSAAVYREENRRRYQREEKRHGRVRSYRPYRAHNAAGAY